MKRISTYFGELTFNKKVMQEKLPQKIYLKLISTITNATPLDRNIADDVAHAMKEWALDNGATHFTHWFQPLRGGTAEKHDAFITYSKTGEIIERFSGDQLIQSEPDASSFPSGGIRSTFEARGYTAWDPSSPAFLIEADNSKTLVIPSVFLSWTGDVLDTKTPLLRSLHTLNEKGLRLFNLISDNPLNRMKVYAGLEQEYFLVAKEHWQKRPDLKNCNRTLFGAPPSKGQQMEDHYFGSIKGRVLAFMEELDHELYRRGIPSKTRHNEVSPNQFEIAPLYEELNLAIDHNLQTMDIMKRIAEKHDLVCLTHEKPFAFVNGSGKHLNWSVGDDLGNNYLEPSKSPADNINFLTTIVAFLAGIKEFGGLLRASIADAGNDHRLGANEAPPAIMSVYLGDYLTHIMDSIEKISPEKEMNLAQINLGLQNIPSVNKDISDRNRTSPIAFTGNKFEFRAVGASQNASEAATILNFNLAYGYDLIYQRLVKLEGDIQSNLLLVMRDILFETRVIRFEGNNYSADWQQEAEKRGLPNTKNTPRALDYLVEENAIKEISRFEILSEREIRAKYEVKLEAYTKTKQIEFQTALKMISTLYLPAISKALLNQSSTLLNLQNLNLKSPVILQEVMDMERLYSEIKLKNDKFKKLLESCFQEQDWVLLAHKYADQLQPEMDQIRILIDEAEEIIATELWPVPKYSNMFDPL